MTAQPADLALQDVWPNGTCYGCGPANPYGLRIKSHWDADGQTVVARFQPDIRYNAGFPNVVYGGLIASLIDCHSIWTAIAHTYRAEGREYGSLPAISYVTGTLTVRYLAPTPLDSELVLRAHVTAHEGRRVTVACALHAGERVTAEGTVQAVRIAADKSAGVAEARETPAAG